MRPIQTAPVRYDVLPLRGGLDLVTPTLSLQPGVAREAQNFEVSITGGYSRLQGYERFDGRPAPSAAQYAAIGMSSLTGISIGSTIQNFAGTVTGVVIAMPANTGSTVLYTKAVGSFAVGDSVYVGATLIGTVQPVSTLYAPTAENLALYRVLASDVYRTDIQAVPGSGQVRGVAVLNGTVYAWRNNAGNTAMVLHKSTGSGWSAVSLGFELGYNTGAGTQIAEGDTVSNLAGTATGVVARVVNQTNTTWIGSSGRLILSSTTGTWAAADQIRVGGVQRATATGAATAITLSPSGRVQTVKGNVAGYSGATRLYGVDGANRGFEFDGTVYVPIVTGMSQDVPTHIAVHRNRLFFSFGSSLQCSGVGTPYVWSPVFGATEIAMPETITGLQVVSGGQTTGTLVIYTRVNTSMLYGTGPSDWNLTNFDRGTGAEPYTSQVLVDVYALDTRGVVNLSTSQNFGNFESSALTFPLKPFVQARRGLATASGVHRDKSQYRLFYSDGSGIYVTVLNGRVIGSMPVQFLDPVRVWAADDTATGAEKSYFGGDAGYVYQLDVGSDFDGVGITANFKVNFASQGSARVLKRYRRASLEVTGEGYAAFDFGYSLGYDSTDIDQAVDVSYSAPFSGAVWDLMTWDTFTWDGRTLAPSETECNGTAENIAVTVRCSSRLTGAFTVNTITLHYSPRRGIR